ncbi:MAG: amidohydrolase family protein [Candidatus Lokiarchaeota archaeon]|nr:amidohydrolase family protein [Candidatus Lokiarchaeota archaeon]
MSNKTFFFKYGFIGEELELKQDIQIEIDENGNIVELIHKNIEDKILRDKIIVPGFINSHIHIGDSFAKEKGFNKPLKDVVAPPNGIKHYLLSITDRLTKIVGIKHAIRELLSNGITCFFDFREEGEAGAKLLKEALEDSSIKCLIFGRYKSVNEIEVVFDLTDGIGLSSYKYGSIQEKNILKEIKKIKNKQVACHCAEVVRDEELIFEIVNDQLIDVMIHGTQLIKKDIEMIIRKNISLVLCPRCNGYFGVGFPPVLEVLSLKVPIAIGTDNLMANSPDLFEELRYLYRIARVLGKDSDSSLLTPLELLKMVTINPARIFKLDSNIGSISKGKKADFFVIDLEDSNYYCQLNREILPTLIVQRTGSHNIKQVFINGKLVFENNSRGRFF